MRESRQAFYLYVPDDADASDYSLIKLNQEGDHREFQVGSFGGITGGKYGMQKDKVVPVKAEHVGIRMYRVTIEEDLKAGPYAFFMATGQSATMSGARGGNRSGGQAAGRVYDFDIPQ